MKRSVRTSTSRRKTRILDAAYNSRPQTQFVTSGLQELASKTSAPTSDWSALAPTEHFVQFYEKDAYIVHSVAEYVAHGLKTGETCFVIATPEHRDAIDVQLASFGFDVDEAKEDKLYIALDARETLAKLMSGKRPDAKLFSKTIGTPVRNAVKVGPVRAFGEMVALLVADGNPKAAVDLENLWNRLRRRHRFSLFCAYPIGDLVGGEAARFMDRICGGHSHVIPDESYMALTTADARLRAIAFLQQRGRQLEAELADLERSIAAKNCLAASVAI